MTKKEIKTATISELAVDAILTNASVSSSYATGRGWERDMKHLNDLYEELLARGFFTQEQIDILNY